MGRFYPRPPWWAQQSVSVFSAAVIVIGVVQGYTHEPMLAVLVLARTVIELLKSNNVN